MAARSRWATKAGGYLVAVATVVAAAVIRLGLGVVLGDQAPFFTFVLAVLVAAWYGGLRPGLLATALGAVLAVALFVRPLPSSWSDQSHLALVTALFLIIGVTASALCGALHTARGRIEDQQRRLQQAEEQARSVVDHVISAIITIDERGSVRSINPAGERLFGYPAAEVLGRNVNVLMPEPYRSGHDGYIANYLRTAAAKVIGIGREVVGRRKDGSTFPMDLAVSEFRIDGHRYFTGIVRDVTERKRAEAEVRRLTGELQGRVDELQTILNLAPVGVAIALDPACRHLTLNSYMGELLGVPAGANGSLSAPPGERPTGYANYRDGKEVPPEELPMQVACTGVEVRDFELDLVRAGRDTRNLICFARPLHDGAGRVRGSVGAFLDITELKQVERALKDADRRKDEFLATLAHELRNPLAPVRNALHLLQQAGSDGPTVEQARRIMERQVSQLVRLVDDLLDVARIAKGKLDLRKQRVELAAVVQNAAEAGRPLIDQMGHDLAVILPPHPVYLDIDPVRIGQVLLNLLNNAAKYTEPGGHIRLTAERHGSDAVVTVTDTGVGIAADQLPHVFELFTQVDRSPDRAQGGLGLGLTLARRLTEMHDGSVEVHSDGPGTGSAFTVRLPVALGPAAAEPPPGDGTTAAARCRILVVDDNADGADSLAELLRLLGNTVATAYDGLEAVRAAEAFRPDVVLLDIGLPKLNGYEAARRIRREPWGARAVLIAVTGWGQEEDRRRSQEAGFDFHMVKPVDPQSLTNLLAGLLPAPADVPA